jgi:hypothetical protein
MFQRLILAQSSGTKKEYMFFKATKILVLRYFLNIRQVTFEGVNVLTICEVQFSAVRFQWWCGSRPVLMHDNTEQQQAVKIGSVRQWRAQIFLSVQ